MWVQIRLVSGATKAPWFLGSFCKGELQQERWKTHTRRRLLTQVFHYPLALNDHQPSAVSASATLAQRHPLGNARLDCYEMLHLNYLLQPSRVLPFKYGFVDNKIGKCLLLYDFYPC